MKYFLIIVWVIISSATACKKEPSTNYTPVNEPIDLRKGLVKNFPSDGITISLDSVINDSRCALDVVCFWEGNAEAYFTCINSLGGKLRFILNTYDSFVTDTLVFGYKIKLVDVKPYPLSYIRIDPDKYTAEILIFK